MKKSILFSVACVLTLTSCATIVAGGNPKITIDGDTKDPVNHGKTKSVRNQKRKVIFRRKNEMCNKKHPSNETWMLFC